MGSALLFLDKTHYMSSALMLWDKYISVIFSQHLKTMNVDYLHIEYMRTFI